MMGKRNNPQFFASDVVNDAVGKSAQREAAPASPRRAKPWIRAQKLQGALEFSHEHKTQVGVFCLSCVVDSSVGEFPVQRPARPMGSFNRGTRAGNGIGGRNELRAATLDLLDAPFDLDSPSFLDLVVLEKTG